MDKGFNMSDREHVLSHKSEYQESPKEKNNKISEPVDRIDIDRIFGRDTTMPNAYESAFETIQVTQEAPWDKRGEDLLDRWRNYATEQANCHKKKGHKLKSRYQTIGICCIITASLLVILSQFTEQRIKPETTGQLAAFYITMATTVANLILVGVHNFLNYGSKYERHFEFEGRFEKLAVTINEILATDREFRSPKDRVLSQYKEVVGYLKYSAPET